MITVALGIFMVLGLVASIVHQRHFGDRDAPEPAIPLPTLRQLLLLACNAAHVLGVLAMALGMMLVLRWVALSIDIF